MVLYHIFGLIKDIDMVFTKKAIKEQELIIKDFPILWEYYSPNMGNFQFSYKDLRLIFDEVERWMKSKKDSSWAIIKEDNYFYLTSEWA